MVNNLMIEKRYKLVFSSSKDHEFLLMLSKFLRICPHKNVYIKEIDLVMPPTLKTRNIFKSISAKMNIIFEILI